MNHHVLNMKCPSFTHNAHQSTSCSQVACGDIFRISSRACALCLDQRASLRFLHVPLRPFVAFVSRPCVIVVVSSHCPGPVCVISCRPVVLSSFCPRSVVVLHVSRCCSGVIVVLVSICGHPLDAQLLSCIRRSVEMQLFRKGYSRSGSNECWCGCASLMVSFQVEPPNILQVPFLRKGVST